MTTGTDLPSSVQLPVWLSRSGADVLKTNPDRRRRPPRHGHVRATWTAATCSPARRCSTRRSSQSGDDPVANLGADRPDGDHQLHRQHRPRRLGLRQRPRRRGHRTAAQHLGRADAGPARRRQRRTGGAGLRGRAPHQGVPAGARLAAAARHRRRGREPSRRSRVSRPRWTRSPSQCVASGCALGPDPKGAIDALLAGAGQGDGPGGVSVATLADAISTALAFPRGDCSRRPTRWQRAGRRPRRRRQPAQRPRQPRRDAAQDRRPVRQLVQRRAQPADPRPGPRTRRRSGASSIRSSAPSAHWTW